MNTLSFAWFLFPSPRASRPARPGRASTRRKCSGLSSPLHKLDAGSAVRHAVAIENGPVHQLIAKDVGDDRGERLSAVDVRKAIVAGKARRREPDDAAHSRNDFGQRFLVVLFRNAEQTPPEEMICVGQVCGPSVSPQS